MVLEEIRVTGVRPTLDTIDRHKATLQLTVNFHNVFLSYPPTNNHNVIYIEQYIDEI